MRTHPTLYRLFARGASALALLATAPPAAQDDPAPDAEAEAEEEQGPAEPTIYVYGRGEERIGQAIAASEGGVAGRDLDVRPLLRPGELLEATPGLIATQHSGGDRKSTPLNSSHLVLSHAVFCLKTK